MPFTLNADDPASAGWGIVFQSDAPAELQAALQHLIDHRRSQFGDAKVKVLFHEPNEAWADWRLGATELAREPSIPPGCPTTSC